MVANAGPSLDFKLGETPDAIREMAGFAADQIGAA